MATRYIQIEFEVNFLLFIFYHNYLFILIATETEVECTVRTDVLNRELYTGRSMDA